MSSLFTLDSPQPWYTVLYVGREGYRTDGGDWATSLYSVRLDGTEPRRISFNPEGDLDPLQVPDGRVIYAGWRRAEYPGQATGGLTRASCSLFAINIDGTDQELYGGQQGKRIQGMPCRTEKGLVVFVETDAPSLEDGGPLGAIEERRPHHSYRRVPADQRYQYLFPSPLQGNRILVSRRPSDGSGVWTVVALDVETGQAEPLLDQAGFHSVQAAVAQARPMPDGRSTVVDETSDAGVLYALNLYEADPRLKPHLASGTIRGVRVIEGVPVHAEGERIAGPARMGRRLLGEAPIEEDGSMHLLVPADTPLELQALDTNGLALASCRWIWVKQRENRGCIGCHEDPELVPENTYVLAVRRPPNKLLEPAGLRRSVSFRSQILPLLQTHCATPMCHGDSKHPQSFALAENGNAGKTAHELYQNLLAREPPAPLAPETPPRGKYVDPGCARTSYLIWLLSGRDQSRPWDRAPGSLHASREIRQMPPLSKGAALTPEEFRLFVEWIDLGAAWEPAPATRAAPAAAKPKRSASDHAGGM